MSADRLEVARLEYDRSGLLTLVFHQVVTPGCSCCIRVGKLSPELTKLWAFPVPCPRHERMAFHYEMDQPALGAREWTWLVVALDRWLDRCLRELDGAVEVEA
jgi:hypothetical protein